MSQKAKDQSKQKTNDAESSFINITTSGQEQQTLSLSPTRPRSSSSSSSSPVSEASNAQDNLTSSSSALPIGTDNDIKNSKSKTINSQISFDTMESNSYVLDNHKNLNLNNVLMTKGNENLFELVSRDSSQLEGCRQCVESRGECFDRINNNSNLDSEIGLLYTNRENYKLRDFYSEVRATMDVEQFVHQAEMILDMTEISVEDIVESMLTKILENEKNPETRLEEAKKIIFIKGSSMLMAKTIQGVYSMVERTKDGQLNGNRSTLTYDQSWLCALCKLPAQISRRHMIIARFKQPINMGDNAHEVRLFMLIITPVKDKSTKNALETGRNFATMLADSAFRQRLLLAKNETEFKSLMMIKAQQLAKAKSLKNRHKYILDAAVHLSMTSLNYSEDDCTNEAPCPLRERKQKYDSYRNKLDFNNNNKNNNDADNSITASGGNKSPMRSPLFNKHPRQSKVIDLVVADSNNTGNSKSSEVMFNDCVDKDYQIFDKKKKPNLDNDNDKQAKVVSTCCSLLSKIEFGKGLWNDFKRRIRKYPSDFSDAFIGPPKTIQKTVATVWFLYFSILLPTIAFSALNTTQTHGHMGDLRKAIIGQAIGGLCFAYFGGQPLVIIMTTAPLCLYTKVIHQMCIDFDYHFPSMYAAVGLWNGVFLIIYSLFGFSKLMKWCTRSTEEIFALFIVIAFITDASKELMKNFQRYYYTPACQAINHTISTTKARTTDFADISNDLESTSCKRETSLLFVLLMLGTLWLATSLYNFRKTPYLEAGKRELLAAYALPLAIFVMSFLGSFIFEDIYVEKFPPLGDIRFERAPVESLSIGGILISLGLGFTLSLLFFMDQNISAAMVNAPQNKLKKGCAYHFDLLVVGVLNGFLTLYGLPMAHGVLPHSPAHVRSLADIEERVEEGHLQEVIVNVRETRVTGIVSHFLILGSLLLIPYPIAYIPTAVLNGLFLYMAVTSLDGLQLFERILLLFTEQSKYPPNHYIRRCPQRKIHQFTIFQLLQLFVMCLFGFSPFNIVEMFFPVIILLMIPFRHKIVTKYIDRKYLEALDGKHQ